MKTVTMSVVLLISILLMAWILYPSSFPARSFVSKQLSPAEYANIKDVLFSFAASNAAHGVTVRGEAGPQGTATLYCRDVPLVVVLQAPTATLMQVFHDAEQRAPSLGPVVNHVLSKMTLIPQPDGRDGGSVGYFNRLFLKYRDGIDLDKTCAS